MEKSVDKLGQSFYFAFSKERRRNKRRCSKSGDQKKGEEGPCFHGQQSERSKYEDKLEQEEIE